MFYQNYWHVVHGDVTKVVMDFLNKGDFNDTVNHTNIVLIPKCKNLERVMDFRPISLCNVLYR